MAGFAPGIDGIGAGGDQTRVIGGPKAPVNFFMALFTFRGADIFCARHLREHHGLVADGAAGNDRQQQDTNDGDRGHAAMPRAPVPELIEE